MTKRCRFSLLALLGPLCLAAAGVAAPAVCADPPAATPDAETAWHEADYFLRHGKEFTYCIENARQAVALAPKVSRYHDTLGCALASRAAAISLADSHLKDLAENQKKFEVDHKLWETAQSTNKPVHGSYSATLDRLDASVLPERDDLISGHQHWRDLHDQLLGPGMPEPAPPPALKTRDDNKPFTLTPDEAAVEYKKLGAEALSEFAAGVDHAANDREKAEAESVQGWGMFLLLVHSSAVNVDLSIKPDAVRHCLRLATELAPTSADYWQGLGDAMMRLRQIDGATENAAKPAAAAPSAVVAAYQKAMTLDGARLTPIGLRIFFLLIPRRSESVSKSPAPDAVATLRDLTRRDPDNALLRYASALLLLNQTDADPGASPTAESHVLEQAEQANALPFRYRRYTDAAPSQLAAAWGYLQQFDLYLDRPGLLVSDLGEALLTQCAPTSGPADDTLARRALAAVLAAGLNLELAGPQNAEEPDEFALRTDGRLLEISALFHRVEYDNSIGNLQDYQTAKAALAQLYDSLRPSQNKKITDALFGYNTY